MEYAQQNASAAPVFVHTVSETATLKADFKHWLQVECFARYNGRRHNLMAISGPERTGMHLKLTSLNSEYYREELGEGFTVFR